jgi:tyrosine-specific transport protein
MKFLEAVLILSGMIIGVGMFGIPFSFLKAGFWLGTFELAALTGVMVLIHLLYARIIIETPSSHRLPGYVRLHLGGRAEILATLVSFFGITGSLLAYILVGSIFLNNIFENFWTGSSEFLWAVVITASGALITLFTLKKEALINGILTAILIGFLGYIIFLLFSQVQPEHFAGVNLKEFFLPYGVLLFALSGSAAIPNLVGLLSRNREKINRAVIIGTIIPAIVYFFFALAVVGATGSSTSEEALAGLKGLVSGGVILVVSLVGFLAVFTSYIILNSNAQALLELDFRFPQKAAWLLASLVPFILYAVGIQNFILIIGAVGAVAGGIEVGLIIAAYHRIRKNQGYEFSWFSYSWKAVIFLMITAGVVYELYRVL